MADDWLEANAYAADAERKDRDRRMRPADATTSVRQRRGLLIGLGVVVLVFVAAYWTLTSANDGRISEARPVEYAKPTSDGLRLHWTGTACETVNTDRTSVERAGTDLTITLYIDVPTVGCDHHVEVEHVHEVAIDGDVGDTEVHDGACRLPGFHGHHRCWNGLVEVR